MLLKIDIKSKEAYFFWNGNKIDLLENNYYKTNILPCKTTILGMLCFYYWIDFNRKINEWQNLKNIFINEFEYWILNNSNSIDLIKKKYTSSFHRTNWGRTQIYAKEYILNLDFTIYLNILEDTLLFRTISDNINNVNNIPGIWDKNLYPDLFNVSLIKWNISKVTNYHWLLLTNNFLLDENIIIQLWNINKKISLYLSRKDYNMINRSEIITVYWWLIDNNINIVNSNIITYNWKWIVLI